MPKAEVRILNDYRVLYVPEHPRAMKNEVWNGYVYEHILVAEEHLGRPLRDDEITHHLDGNRANNRKENIIVLERSQHAKLHIWLDAGAPISERYRMNGMNSGKSNVAEPTYCKSCGRTLQGKQKTYCSQECSSECRRKAERPSKAELEKDIKNLSWLSIGKKYGVSDNAARKWAKTYGLR